MTEHKATPFELATLAAILSLQDPHTRRKPIESYLEDAKALLSSAVRDIWLSEHDALEKHLYETGQLLYSFEEVLTKCAAPRAGQTKGRTMVGGITTRAGLSKAIRRVFEPHVAEAIIKNDSLSQVEVNTIRADHYKRKISKTKAANQSKNKQVK